MAHVAYMKVAALLTDLDTKAVADKLGQPLENVQMWRTRDRIPLKFWGPLIEAFPGKVSSRELAEFHIESLSKEAQHGS